MKRFLGFRRLSTQLQGIKILDLTRILAGPYCTMMLGDMGAEVVKVEHPLGDDTRRWGPPFVGSESAYFLSVNRNKKSIAIDFKRPQGLEIIKKLAAKSDVLVENYLPGKLEKMGLGYEEVKKVNPKIIFASISGYGPTGPYSSRPGYDLIIEAEAGLMSITGEPYGPPMKVGVAITDLTTGLYTQSAILGALFARERNGLGTKIDTSLIECQVASLANIASSHLAAGVIPKRWGTQHESIVPYQSFKAKDKYIAIGIGNDAMYQKFCKSIERLDLLADEFKTNQKRVENRVKLLEKLDQIIISEDSKHWLSLFTSLGIPCGPVNDIKETFAHPQIKHRKMVEEIHHPTAGKIKLVGIPVKYSSYDLKIRSPPPILGQHSMEILKNLDYTSNEISHLIKESVVIIPNAPQ